MSSAWCPVCHSLHADGAECPGELAATGPERHGWRVTVETPWGLEAYGVLVAPCGERWRARILTYPNVLWRAPGLKATAKFTGGTPRQAEASAIDFIRKHCDSKGFTCVERPLAVQPAVAQDPTEAMPNRPGPAPRKVRFLPIRFGVVRPAELGGTGNLSESGVFILTEMPVEPGRSLSMALDLEQQSIPLSGRVVWMRRTPREGRAAGMGVALEGPPRAYVDYVRSLAG